MAARAYVVAALAIVTLTGCNQKGACVVPTRARGGGSSEVCFWQTEKTCLATPSATSGETPPVWLRHQTCPEAGFRCVGIGFATGNRRPQIDGTCPPGSEGPF